MTSLVGIKCTNGVVIGADSAATFGPNSQQRTMEQPTEKIDILDGNIIVAGTGAVGLNQRCTRVIRTCYNANRNQYLRREAWDVAKDITKCVRDDFIQTGVAPNRYGALVAFPTSGYSKGLWLFEYALEDLQPELKDERIWYCSMGSGELITDPFLAFIREVFWQDGPPSLVEGVFAVTWTLDHVISCNPGGVNGPLRIAVLEDIDNSPKARLLEEQELQEHRQNIEEAKEALRQYRQGYGPVSGEVSPEIPRLK